MIVVSTPSNHPLHTTQTQSTVPLAVAGVGLHIIHTIVIVAPSSTHVTLVVTVVPLLAGLGLVPDHGVTGALSSIINVGTVAPVFVLPEGSVTTIILLLPFNNPHVAVAVQSTTPLAVAGSGEHNIPTTVTLAPNSTHESESIILVPLMTGLGESPNIVGVAGGVVSTTFTVLVT